MGAQSITVLFLLIDLPYVQFKPDNCVRRRRTLPNRDATVRCQVKSRSGVVAFASFWCSHVNHVTAARIIIYLLHMVFIFLEWKGFIFYLLCL